MKKINSRGFTLIELLVVIAIIGILSGIIIMSLSSARNKSIDAKIKAQLSSIKVLAEQYYDEHGSYDKVCTTDPGAIGDSKYWKTLPDIIGCDTANACFCEENTSTNNDGVDYAVAYKLRSKADTYFCVDSTGAAGDFTGATAESVVVGSGGSGDLHVCHNSL